MARPRCRTPLDKADAVDEQGRRPVRVEPTKPPRDIVRVGGLADLLTKDPERLMSHPAPTMSSPARTMTRSELGRYLDYCSELLSLTSKIAALFVERFDDPVTLGAVNEIESLTAGLSRKIWQKISMLNVAV